MCRSIASGIVSLIFFLAAAQQAAALDSLLGALSLENEIPNPFRGMSIPSRDRLWAASPIHRGNTPPSRLGKLSVRQCESLLLDMAAGFHALRPEAPNPGVGNSLEWKLHVEMERFRDLFWCSLKGEMEETLIAIDALDTKPVPMPYRINVLTYDFSQFDRWPSPFQTIRGVITDLATLSLRGHAPAMVALAKLSARDDVVRLTPQFVYFLLTSARRRMALDSQAERLLAWAKLTLTPKDRSVIDERVQRGTWPLEDSMVIE